MNGGVPQRIESSEIESAANLFDKLFRKRRREQADAVRETGELIEKHLGAWRDQLRKELEEHLSAVDGLGFPPSFVRVAGQSHLEKPLNRLLAWLADPDGDHGLGCAFLARLAHFVGLPEMAEDVGRGEKVDLVVEATLEDDGSGKAPDLVARTSRAALLLENKVHAPESGPDQYGSYLEIFTGWAEAGGVRKRRAVLCSREQRKPPKDWNTVILHADVADILYEIGRVCGGAPIWGRIAAVMCAVAFENSNHNEETRQARALLEETRTERPTSDQVIRLRSLSTVPPPPIPWERSV